MADSKRPVNAKVASWKVLGKNIQRALSRELTPAIYGQFHEYYLAASAAPEDTSDVFMGMMNEVSEGTIEKATIDAETTLIAKKVPALEKYLRTYLIGHVMTVAAIRYGDAPTNIDIEVPPLHTYIYSIMQHVAEESEANPDLFNPNGNRRQVKQRQLNAAKIIKSAIYETTADMLPTDKMIEDYIEDIANSGPESDKDSDSEDDFEDELLETGDFVVTSSDVSPEPKADPTASTEGECGDGEMKIQIPKKNWQPGQADVPDAPPIPQKLDMMAGLEDKALD